MESEVRGSRRGREVGSKGGLAQGRGGSKKVGVRRVLGFQIIRCPTPVPRGAEVALREGGGGRKKGHDRSVG